jgi:Undecaprenyl-phosphate galactose phosphotransferase WbaP
MSIAEKGEHLRDAVWNEGTEAQRASRAATLFAARTTAAPERLSRFFRYLPFVLALTDLAALLVSVVAAGAVATIVSEQVLGTVYSGWRGKQFANHLAICGGLAIGLVSWLAMRDEYSARRPLHVDLKTLAQALAFFVLLDGFIEYASKEDFSRLWVVAVWPIGMLFVSAARISVRRVLDRRDLWRVSTIMIGAGEHRDSVAHSLSRDAYVGYRITGRCQLSEILPGNIQEIAQTLQHEFARRQARTAILVPTPREMEDLGDIIDALNLRMIPYVLVPPIQRLPLSGLAIQGVLNSDAILMSAQSGLLSPFKQWVKRSFDIVASILFIIFLAPILIALSLLIARDGGAPVFGHERIGRNGVPFKCLKLRTMVRNSDEVLRSLLASDPAVRDEWSRNFKLENDPRITALGRFLRSTSLDELPQVFNVLRGEMSFVGPRPVVAKELEQYYGDDALYYQLVRPGITGLWQVNGRSSTTYERRVHLDAWYVRNWSLWTDLRVLILTIPSVLAQRGAH